MITFKQFLAEANQATPAQIAQRVLDIRDGKHEPISKRTCWNQVGLYLRKHPETKGEILLYGVDDGTPVEKQYVNHVVLVSATGDILVDAGGGTVSTDQKTYTNKAGDDHLDLITKHTL